DQLVLRARVLGSPTWDTLKNLVGPTFNVPSALATSPPPINDFKPELIYLDSAKFVGQLVEFEFIGVTDFGPNAYVDDFVVQAVPLCPDPINLVATNLQGFQATIGWQSASTGIDFEI